MTTLVERARMVPEARIKRLVCVEVAALGAIVDPETAKRNLCEQMGHAIAAKLFEFNKVRFRTEEDGSTTAFAKIDVIVPEGPPEELSEPQKQNLLTSQSVLGTPDAQGKAAWPFS